MCSAVTLFCCCRGSEGCLGLPRPTVYRDDRAQVGDALLGNADKHGEADGPEEPKARCGSFCAGLVVVDPDSARGRWKGAGAQFSDFVLLISAELLVLFERLFSFRLPHVNVFVEWRVARRLAEHCWKTRTSTERPTGRRRRRPAGVALRGADCTMSRLGAS